MAKVRKDLEGSVIAVNESEQYQHLIAGQKIPEGYFVGGHAVEDGDPSDQTPPWKTEPGTGPSAPAEGQLEQLITSGASPEEIVAAVAASLGVSHPAAKPQPDDGDAIAAKKAAKKPETTENAAGGTPPAAEGELVPPPLSGTGSGAPAWREYAVKAIAAAGLEIAFEDDATRTDIVEALKSAGVRTE